jgi:NADPH2:quinone reductase
MKTMLCESFDADSPLVLRELEPAPLKASEVRVAVHACGVNFPDTLIVQGKYQFKPTLPFAPGAEAAGVVIETGAGVTHFKAGDHVLRFGLHGGFADELIATEEELIALPESMSFTDAAAFLMVYGTSYHALVQRAGAGEGDTVLVLGAAGGVGLAAVDLASAMGCRVIAAASSEERLAVARGYGAEQTVNYAQNDLKAAVKELTAGNGVDIVYDPVGGPMADQALRCIAVNGRYLIVGFASGEIQKIPANLPLLKECQIVGVFYGAFVRRERILNADNNAKLFEWNRSGKIKPLVHQVLPLARANEALALLAARRVVGKLVLSAR